MYFSCRSLIFYRLNVFPTGIYRQCTSRFSFSNDCKFSFIQIINRKLNYFKKSLSSLRNCQHPTGNNRYPACGDYYFQIG